MRVLPSLLALLCCGAPLAAQQPTCTVRPGTDTLDVRCVTPPRVVSAKPDTVRLPGRVDTLWLPKPIPPVDTVAPPVVTTGCTHEPVGWRRVMNDPFTTSPNGVPDKQGKWSTALAGPQKNLAIVADSTGPLSPGTVLRVFYPKGAPGGYSTARMGFNPLTPNTGKLYFCVAVRLSANWTNNGNSGTKFVFLHNADATDHPVKANNYFGLTNYADAITPMYATQEDVGFKNYTGAISFKPGVWVRYEAVIDAVGGTLTIWGNGQQIVSAKGGTFLPAGIAKRWDYFWLDPTYGGGTKPVPADQWFDLDHWITSVQ